MIQTALSFILGFLVAAALALAVAPALWRRAGELARRRMEASMPLTREELQSEVDALRAEHAMAMRRLEMKAEAIKKKAAQDMVDINVLREEVKRLDEECAARDEHAAKLAGERDDLAARLSEREAEIKALSNKRTELEEALAERASEVEELSRLYEEASLTSSSRQVELVAREADIERLNDTIGLLRGQRKEADRVAREAAAEKGRVEEALRVERGRARDLERKLERMMRDLSDRNERLERREREIERLKRKIRSSAGGEDGGIPGKLAEAEEEKTQLEMRVADLSLQLSSLLSAEGGEGADKPATTPELERLKSRLTALTRENKKLRGQLDAEKTSGDEALREEISNLTAQVVNMAATLEGPDSPIEKALAEVPAEAKDSADARPLSLAERVRALREGSAAAE